MEAHAALTTPQTNSFFDSYSKHYDLVDGLLSYRRLMWEVYEALRLEPGARVLDAGCGTANFERFISQKALPPVEIEAVDFSRGMLSLAAEKCSDLGYVSFDHADLSRPLPFADASFDRVVSINVLYAVPDWRSTMRELLRVLAPGGRLVISSTREGWSYWPLFTEHYRRISNIRGLGRKAEAALHPLRWFSPRGLGSVVSNMFVQDGREREGVYPSFTDEELHELFAEFGPEIRRHDVRPVYAEQCLLAVAEKAQSPLLH